MFSSLLWCTCCCVLLKRLSVCGVRSLNSATDSMFAPRPTQGWVQSYGSRYVRPPIIHGDVAFTRPMTVREFAVAQQLTARPVKGMLTGKREEGTRVGEGRDRAQGGTCVSVCWENVCAQSRECAPGAGFGQMAPGLYCTMLVCLRVCTALSCLLRCPHPPSRTCTHTHRPCHYSQLVVPPQGHQPCGTGCPAGCCPEV